MGLQIFGEPLAQAHWQPSPDGRGTFDILETCIVTLVLCVYSAVHVNITTHGLGVVGKILVKAKFVTVALLAPEIIVYMAWAQRQDASAMLKVLCEGHKVERKRPWYGRFWHHLVRRPLWNREMKTSSDEKLPEVEYDRSFAPVEKRKKYTMTHGFFFCMGGLAFDLSNDPLRMLPEDRDRYIIHPEYLIWMLRNGYEDVVPRLEAEDIRDRSKADGLVKAIAVIQALWFCFQFITRLAQDLPITLLELNTFAHAVCALLVYILWWEKPLDIAESLWLPTERDERYRRLCAYQSGRPGFCFHQAVLAGEKPGAWGKTRNLLLGDLSVFSTDPNAEFKERDDSIWDLRAARRSLATVVALSKNKFENLHSILRRKVSNKLVLHLEGWSRSSEIPPTAPNMRELQATNTEILFTSYDPPIIYLKKGDKVPGTPFYVRMQSAEADEATLVRLQYLGKKKEDEKKLEKEKEKLRPQQKEQRDRWEKKQFPEYALVDSVSNYWGLLALGKNRPLSKPRSLIQELDSTAQRIALTTCGLIYGGLHMLAYGVAFPTRAESTLWTISAITILCYCPVKYGLEALFELVLQAIDFIYKRLTGESIDDLAQRWIKERPMALSLAFVTGLFYAYLWNICTILLYILGRCFIIVEVFRALAYVDLRAYQTPNWTLYFPHVG